MNLKESWEGIWGIEREEKEGGSDTVHFNLKKMKETVKLQDEGTQPYAKQGMQAKQIIEIKPEIK